MARLALISNCLLFLSLFFPTTLALNMPFERRVFRGTPNRSLSRPPTNATGQIELNMEYLQNINDERYVINITINKIVALDTGSTDLWVLPPGGLGTFNNTGIPIKLVYGDGSYGTTGTIGVSPFALGTYTVDRQAFMSATTSTIGGLQEDGIYGLMGLGFDSSKVSPINQKIKSIYGPDATWGRSVLLNIFAEDPAIPNLFGIDLSRSVGEDTTGGSLSIGEYDVRFADVTNEPKLPQYPKGAYRWTTLCEEISVNEATIPLQSTIRGVPEGNIVALFDTGEPRSVLPINLFDAIYSRIPGSALYNDPSQYTRMWLVPCNTTANVVFTFASKNYSVHPLDLSTISAPFTMSGRQYIVCASSIVGVDNWGAGDLDISLGDTFLRNIYTVFNFGDTSLDGSEREPYLQLLAKTDPVEATAEVASIRGKIMASLPPEMAPADFVAAALGTR